MASWLKALFGSKKPEPVPSEDTDDSKEKRRKKRPWIGVDLDGTLAEYTKWSGPKHIGKPVPLMKQRVLEWVEAGYKVKVMTARASIEDGIEPVQKWLAKNGFPELEVTNEKDFQMVELWDDRAIQVIENTGRPVIRPSMSSKPKSPLFSDEKINETFEAAKLREESEEEE